MLESDESPADDSIHVLEVAGNAIVGGMEKYVYNLAQHMPAKGFTVSVVVPFESAFTASLRNLGSQVYITNMDNDPPWRSIQYVTELVKQLHVDILHAHLPRAHVLAGLTGKLTGRPVVATVHGMDITTQELGIAHTTGSNLTVVCQEAYAQALSLGFPAERVTLIPNGVDMKTFNPNRTGQAFRRALHIPPGAPLVGMVGRISWEKGPDFFLDVAGVVHTQLPEVHFVLVGDGPALDEIRDQISERGLSEVVHLAGVWTNTWEVYPALDVVLLTSRVEGMPFALLEAMACARPVATMSVGGVREIVEVGTTGVTSAGGDFEGLGNAVVKLLNDPELARQMGQAGRKRVEEYFDLRTSVNLMSNLFCRLLGRKPETATPPSPVLNTPWPAPEGEAKSVPVEAAQIFRKRN